MLALPSQPPGRQGPSLLSEAPTPQHTQTASFPTRSWGAERWGWGAQCYAWTVRVQHWQGPPLWAQVVTWGRALEEFPGPHPRCPHLRSRSSRPHPCRLPGSWPRPPHRSAGQWACCWGWWTGCTWAKGGSGQGRSARPSQLPTLHFTGGETGPARTPRAQSPHPGGGSSTDPVALAGGAPGGVTPAGCLGVGGPRLCLAGTPACS